MVKSYHIVTSLCRAFKLFNNKSMGKMNGIFTFGTRMGFESKNRTAMLSIERKTSFSGV